MSRAWWTQGGSFFSLQDHSDHLPVRGTHWLRRSPSPGLMMTYGAAEGADDLHSRKLS